MTSTHLTKIKKVVTLDLLVDKVKHLRKSGKIVVWTSGCFDILHAGHVHYLQQAKELGDFLIVGLNSDVSIKALKGENRPIFSQLNRATVLNAIECVDCIFIFDEQRPVEILTRLKPEFYVKGGDYNIDSIDQDERRIESIL